MALERPLYMQPAPGDPAIQYTAQQDRAGLLAMTFSREGVHDLRGGHLRVTQRAAGANFTVDVAPGRCAIQGDDISDQGMYICNSTTTVNLTVPAKPASGSRTHRVIARIRDKLSSGTWSQYDWTIEILTDTGSGTPAQPNSAITLAFITVSNATVSITNGNIDDSPRKRASTGTAAVEGLWGAIYSEGFLASDVTRPLRWSVNPDGWVQLSGWVKWNTINASVATNESRTFGGTPLADPAVKSSGVRDVVGATAWGPMRYQIFPDGHIAMLPHMPITLVSGANAVWWSFDNIMYRI